MTLALLLSVLGASLVGSVHCAGMCGGVVGFAGAALNRRRRRAGQAAYHLGRFAAYLGLGAAAGAFGLGVNTAAARGGIGGGAALLAGSLMVVWALSKLLPGSVHLARIGAWLPVRVSCGYSRAFSRLVKLPPLLRASALGIATGLLPCGWLYAFVVAAGATGSLADGAAVLFAFWLGTLPALIGIGSVTQLLSERARKWLPTLSASLLLVVGIGNLWTRYETGLEVLTWSPVRPAGLLNPALTGNGSAGTSPAASAPLAHDLPPCHRH